MRQILGVIGVVLVLAAAWIWGESRYQSGYEAARAEAEAAQREKDAFEYYAAAVPAALEDLQRLKQELAQAAEFDKPRIREVVAGAVYDYGYLYRDYHRAVGGRKELFTSSGAREAGLSTTLPSFENLPFYWRPDESQRPWEVREAICNIVRIWDPGTPIDWRPDLRRDM